MSDIANDIVFIMEIKDFNENVIQEPLNLILCINIYVLYIMFIFCN